MKTDEDNPNEATTQNGVGPWIGQAPTQNYYDPELIKNGDHRNVVDKYRYWSLEAIVADLDKKRHNFHVAIENWQHDLNIGSIVRTANAFLAKEVHIIGKKRWNRRGAMVTDRYQHIKHHQHITEFVNWAKNTNLQIIGIDNFPNSRPLETYKLPYDCVLVFGQESVGLTEAMHAACDVVLEIGQYGSTRSINASAAGAIALHAWIRQHVFQQTPKI